MPIDDKIINNSLLEVSQRIRFLRIRRNVKQLELAEALGISQANMSNIERGRTGLTISNLLKIQQYLDCPIYAFFPDSTQKSTTPVLIKDLTFFLHTINGTNHID